jgi:hypothetical protein
MSEHYSYQIDRPGNDSMDSDISSDVIESCVAMIEQLEQGDYDLDFPHCLKPLWELFSGG